MYEALKNYPKKQKEVNDMLFDPKEKDRAWLNALILVLVAIVVIVILVILGPAISNVFSNIIANL
jgi:pilus assembly protein Flp/PilA